MPGYAYAWEFLVRPGREGEFVRHYGPDGTWAELFRLAPGYVQTLLLRDREDGSRFVTVDLWESVEAFEDFRRRFAEEFARLDEACEALTLEERTLGTYEIAGEANKRTSRAPPAPRS